MANSNQNLITNYAKLFQVEQDYLSPTAQLPSPYNRNISTVYVFLSKVIPFQDPNNPPVPTQDQQYIKQIFNNMIVAKKVLTSGISPVIPRIDWTSGTTYDFYRDDVDMFSVDINGIENKEFYVKNRYEQIFKCLWNNSTLDNNGNLVGSPSTVEPSFQPGLFNEKQIFQSSDGYKWKYMYTIDSGSKLNFLDSTWIPVPINILQTSDPTGTSAGYGEVTVINVTNGGSGYSNTVLPTIIVNGDGYGATASVSPSNIDPVTGAILDITVNTTGKNYTYATVSISSASGSGASAIAPVSPIGGHNYNAVAELGCNHAMITTEFNGNEGGYLPTGIQYYQVGMIINPTTQSLRPLPANGKIYSCTTDITVAAGQGVFQLNDFVWQGVYDSPSFTGTVLNFDSSNNVVKLINTTGTPTINNTLYGLSGAVRTALNINSIDFVKYSGYITYVENRTGVQRSDDGIEQIKFVIGY